jgi:phosphoketolase
MRRGIVGKAAMDEARSLSDLKNRSENSAGRGQILPVLQVNSRSIDQESGEI